jgi:hypothetical protein
VAAWEAQRLSGTTYELVDLKKCVTSTMALCSVWMGLWQHGAFLPYSYLACLDKTSDYNLGSRSFSQSNFGNLLPVQNSHFCHKADLLLYMEILSLSLSFYQWRLNCSRGALRRDPSTIALLCTMGTLFCRTFDSATDGIFIETI